MFSKIKDLLLDYKSIKPLLGFHSVGIMHDMGWFLSFKTKSSVDQDGNPIPWLTYSFIKFLEDKWNDEFSIFEYGSGNSTIYFSKKAKVVYAVENNKDWYNAVLNKVDKNKVILLFEDYFKDKPNSDYAQKVKTIDINFDIIIVDGRDRVNCVKNSISKLTNAGVIILDNSDRKEYTEAYTILKNEGFKYIDFWGTSPGVQITSCTTIFYKKDNCFGI